MSNVRFSSINYDSTIGGLTGILVTSKEIWVASPSKGMVVAYKKHGKKCGCSVRSFNIANATGLAKLGKDILVSTSGGSIYLISHCSDVLQLQLNGLGTIAGIATRGNKHLYVANISDSSVWVYKVSCSKGNRNGSANSINGNNGMNPNNGMNSNNGMNPNNGNNGIPLNNYELTHRYGDTSLTSLSYVPVNVYENAGVVYVVYNNMTSMVGSGYVNVLMDKCLHRLINRGNLTQPYGATVIGSHLYIGSTITGTVSIYEIDLTSDSQDTDYSEDDKGNKHKHSRKHKPEKRLMPKAIYQNNLSNASGGWLINGGVSQMTYSEEDNSLYMAINADMGRIGSVEVVPI